MAKASKKRGRKKAAKRKSAARKSSAKRTRKKPVRRKAPKRKPAKRNPAKPSTPKGKEAEWPVVFVMMISLLTTLMLGWLFSGAGMAADAAAAPFAEQCGLFGSPTQAQAVAHEGAKTWLALMHADFAPWLN